jgi:hypothetical protein
MAMPKRERSERLVVLRCNVDEETVLAAESEVTKSAVINSFAVVPDTIDLPFTRDQARAWLTAQGDGKVSCRDGMRMMTFHECTEALQVRRCVLCRCCWV